MDEKRKPEDIGNKFIHLTEEQILRATSILAQWIYGHWYDKENNKLFSPDFASEHLSQLLED